MNYSIYKFEFLTGVHFGIGMLNETANTFQADQLFSALYIEALKMQMEEEFLDAVRSGRLLFSDAFPYMGQQYFVPKPMVYVEPVKKGVSEQKKAYKKLKFLPIDKMDNFLEGTLDPTEIDMKDFGKFRQETQAAVRREKEDTLPYRVGVFYFGEKSGLYILTAWEQEEDKQLLEELLESLSYTGIGGKKFSGLGKFNCIPKKVPEQFMKQLEKKAGRYMLLSPALPRDEELEEALSGASYQLEKRSGFVASSEYAPEWRRKKDLYVFQAGSCFEKKFEGDIYDVSDGGNHLVYRYAKPLFMRI